jgi:predicted dehydrogenase
LEPVTLNQGHQLRHVVIGVGAGIFKSHRAGLALPPVQLVGVSDINEKVGRQRANELDVPFYVDYRRMLAETRPEVAIILTPPPLHAEIAIACLQAGCHVLLEKPIAIRIEDADAMVAAARAHGRLLGVMFQHRYRPEVRAARRLIQQGQLGSIERVEMSAVWTRPASYFQQAAWRGTWSGEGGGVLINQAQHNLDVLCFLFGLPRRVSAWTRNQLHRIEAEDTAQAMLEWSDGALGSFHVSTAEADIKERIKVVGTGGMLEMVQGRLSVHAFDMDVREYVATCPDPYAALGRSPVEVEIEEGKGNHLAVYQGFYDVLLNGGTFVSDGEQGSMALELANAMVYASYMQHEVELPLDRQGYSALLARLQQHVPD